MHERLKAALDCLPSDYRGPGGVVAVVKDGIVIAERAWGYADMENRIPMSTRTPMPICSLTKQFVCAALLDIDGNAPGHPVQLGLEDLHPGFIPQGLTVEHLCNNQSGIRDYWALTLLMGAKPEGKFTANDAWRIQTMPKRTLQFEPGEQYSYSNSNFYILGRLIEMETGSGIGDALRKSVFEPAGMLTAAFCEDTSSHPGNCVGYEGSPTSGFVRAENNIWWSGDAGIVASLEDLMAYEQWIDATRDDANGLYRRLCRPQTFRDGTPARYGYGLAHSDVNGIPAIGHSGAIRGFRIERLHAPSERLSVIAMFNHEAKWGAAERILKSVLDQPIANSDSEDVGIDPALTGNWLEPKTNLVLAVSHSGKGGIDASFAGCSEHLAMDGPASASSRKMRVSIAGKRLRIERFGDHLNGLCEKVEGAAGQDCAGSYYCDELESTFSCSGDAAGMYGAFEGFLGAGPMHLMRHIGGDVWMLENPRGMDAPAPGDWSVIVSRGGDGKVAGATIGCWLALNMRYNRDAHSGSGHALERPAARSP